MNRMLLGCCVMILLCGCERNDTSQLIKELQDKDVSVRVSAAEALAIMGPEAKEAIPNLIEALKDEDRLVQQYAVEALRKIGPPALPALIEALKDKDSEVTRYRAADTLGKIGPGAKEAIPALKDALKDKADLVNQYAAEALRKIDPSDRSIRH